MDPLMLSDDFDEVRFFLAAEGWLDPFFCLELTYALVSSDASPFALPLSPLADPEASGADGGFLSSSFK